MQDIFPGSSRIPSIYPDLAIMNKSVTTGATNHYIPRNVSTAFFFGDNSMTIEHSIVVVPAKEAFFGDQLGGLLID